MGEGDVANASAEGDPVFGGSWGIMLNVGEIVDNTVGKCFVDGVLAGSRHN